MTRETENRLWRELDEKLQLTTCNNADIVTEPGAFGSSRDPKYPKGGRHG